MKPYYRKSNAYSTIYLIALCGCLLVVSLPLSHYFFYIFFIPFLSSFFLKSANGKYQKVFLFVCLHNSGFFLRKKRAVQSFFIWNKKPQKDQTEPHDTIKRKEKQQSIKKNLLRLFISLGSDSVRLAVCAGFFSSLIPFCVSPNNILCETAS